MVVESGAGGIDWQAIFIPLISIGLGFAGTLMAKQFRAGKKEGQTEGQDKLFDNMLTNTVKDQVALKEQLGCNTNKITDMNLRLTKLETILNERDKFQRLNDKNYSAFRDRQEDNDRPSWR